MLRSATELSRLHLTAEHLAVDGSQALRTGALLVGELKRFPPVEDVVVVLDRIASRAFAA